jgi:hypothetical protein
MVIKIPAFESLENLNKYSKSSLNPHAANNPLPLSSQQ